jgi:ABC-2 type transport system permease protein
VARLFRAELLRVVSGRSLLTLAILAVALNCLAILGNGASQADTLDAGTSSLAGASHELLRLGFGALLFATLFGAILTTSEFRHGSIARSLFVSGRPERLMAAKSVAALASGVIFGILGAGSALATSAIYLSSRGHHLVLDQESVLIIVGVFAVCVLSALWGMLIGWVVRAQLPALIGIMAWTLIAESAIVSLAPGVGRFLPGGAQTSIYRDFANGDPLATPYGYLLFLSWIGLAAFVSVVLVRRKDLT